MRKVRAIASLIGFALAATVLLAQTKETPVVTTPLDSLHGLEAVNGKAEITTYRGRRAMRLLALPEQATPDHPANNASMLAIVTGSDFHNGTVEVDVAGVPAAGDPVGSLGFIGLLVRAQEHEA